MKYLKDIDVKGKKVLIRADLNVPLSDELSITDTNRIKQFLPSLKYILENGGKPIVMSHLGRPQGDIIPEFSLKPVASSIQEMIGHEVIMAPDCLGPAVKAMADSLEEGKILLLENLRYHQGETKNDPEFSKALAELGDIYVSDAFATAHRAHASMVGVPAIMKKKAAGFLLQNEIEYFEKAMLAPKRPLCVVLGGAKVSSKLATLLNIADKADKIIIGGAMANTFLAAQGLQMGRSLYEQDLFPQIFELLGSLAIRKCALYLPVDLRIGTSLDSKGIARVVTAQEVPADTMALDIGPATSLLYGAAVENAETIVWNGPMGAFENEDYAAGTTDMVQSLSMAHGMTLVGGGDTDAAIHQMELAHKFDYISTGGGAFLALMEGKSLPGFAALG